MADDLKSRYKTSEFWMTLITTMMSVAVVILQSDKAVAWASAIGTILMAAVYAVFQTKLPSDRPGWKTMAFWNAVITVLASVALAVSELDLPGLPKGVTRIASMIVAALTAGGYTVYRRQVKISSQEKLKARLKG